MPLNLLPPSSWGSGLPATNKTVSRLGPNWVLSRPGEGVAPKLALKLALKGIWSARAAAALRDRHAMAAAAANSFWPRTRRAIARPAVRRFILLSSLASGHRQERWRLADKIDHGFPVEM